MTPEPQDDDMAGSPQPTTDNRGLRIHLVQASYYNRARPKHLERILMDLMVLFYKVNVIDFFVYNCKYMHYKTAKLINSELIFRYLSNRYVLIYMVVYSLGSRRRAWIQALNFSYVLVSMTFLWQSNMFVAKCSLRTTSIELKHVLKCAP